MCGKLGRHGRRAMPLQIARRCHCNTARGTGTSHHQRGVRDFAAVHGEIQPIFDHVAEPVAHDQVDPEPWMVGKQHRKPRRKEATARDRDTNADEPHRGRALAA